MYENKTTQYFNGVRLSLLNCIPQDKRKGKMLEIGAGRGATSLFAKKNGYAQEIYGVELCEFQNSGQKSNEFKDFIIGNIEELSLPYEENFFDVILCGDVLEHLIDPYETVKKLKNLLKLDGIMVVSIPNIREFTILRSIVIDGDFKYTEEGILDKTHLRFFCKKNMEDLFVKNDLEIISINSNVPHLGGKRKLFNTLTFGFFEEFLAIQYYIVLRKKND